MFIRRKYSHEEMVELYFLNRFPAIVLRSEKHFVAGELL